jgi:DNA repair exonuclease SbcCD ATPase subunit
MIFSKSLTETKRKVLRALKEKEQNNVAQLQQQVDELKQQLDQRTKELAGIDQNEQQLDQQRLALENKEVQIEQQRANTDAALGWAKDEKDGQRVALERDQAIANAAPQSAEIKNK